MTTCRFGPMVGFAVLCACQSKPAEVPQPVEAPAPAQTVLDGLDARTPVPLVPMMANHQKANMRDHLAVVQEIVAALGAGDDAAVARAAGRMGYSEQMGQMCSHMGAGAPGFTERAIAFHHSADTIAEAARKHDRAGMIVALDATLQACTGCHAAYKQHVVDDAEWSRLTAMQAPTGHH